MRKTLQAALQALQAPCQTVEDREVADNATGVLARVLAEPPLDQLRELAQQLPPPMLCRAFFASLPLRVQLEECAPVVWCLVQMASDGHPFRELFEPAPAARALHHALFHPKGQLVAHKIEGQLEAVGRTLFQQLYASVPAVQEALPPLALMGPEARKVLEGR